MMVDVEISKEDVAEWMRDGVTKKYFSLVKEQISMLENSWRTPLDDSVGSIAIFQARRMGTIEGLEFASRVLYFDEGEDTDEEEWE